MENTSTNMGAGRSGMAQPLSGTGATAPIVKDKAQDRTILYVVAGVIVLGIIIWLATRNNDSMGQGQMDQRSSEQVERLPAGR